MIILMRELHLSEKEILNMPLEKIMLYLKTVEHLYSEVGKTMSEATNV